MSTPVELVRRPEAKTDSVEDLVAAALRGEVRIPVFQRGLEWQSTHVLDLFDSIYRGFPIGSLLLRRAPSTAGPVRIGPVSVFGIETRSALWVVDGQQRLTSLVAGLGRPGTLPTTPDDPFIVYLDPLEQQFHAPPRDGQVPSTWVPIPQLLDGAQLTEWVYAWEHGKDDQLRRIVFEAGRRLREYKVPLYIIETDDEEAVRAIFHRVNTSGKPLSWHTVHDALYGHKSDTPSTLGELASRLEQDVGMGRPDKETQLLPCLVALRGLDVTKSLGEHIRHDPKVLQSAVAEALPVLREVLSFLRVSAEIPHLRLLPFSAPMVVLTRFFKKHPEPNERTTTLLVRWVWRCFLGGGLDERTLKRHGVASITDDEEASVQALLTLAPDHQELCYSSPDSFDARSAQSRLALLGLASLHPRKLGLNSPSDASEVDIAALIREIDRDAFRPLFPLTGGLTTMPGNRVLLPGHGPAAPEFRSFIQAHGLDHPVLRSHFIWPDIASMILDGDPERAIERRNESFDGLVDELGDRLAEWGRTDRPSLEYLLAQVAE
jgi:hypothetical protein